MHDDYRMNFNIKPFSSLDGIIFFTITLIKRSV